MIVETHFALVDEILAGWKSRIGDDYAGYRNHVYRVLNFCFALREAMPRSGTSLLLRPRFTIWVSIGVGLGPLIGIQKGPL